MWSAAWSANSACEDLGGDVLLIVHDDAAGVDRFEGRPSSSAVPPEKPVGA